jgi:hypothetical protein
MTKIKKKETPPQVVIPDTNILWFKDKGPVVNPDFDAFWDQNSSKTVLELVVPDVVKGELLYQQTTSLRKAFEKIKEHTDLVCHITAKAHQSRVDQKKAEEQVEAKFDKWLATKGGKLSPIPYNAINWQTLCRDSIWRLPPFESNPDQPDFEKGFRDALILETLCDYCARETRDVQIAFICNDFLLRTTADKRLASNARFSTYETLNQYASYIKLTQEQLENEFIKNIISKAAQKFYLADDENCLIIREKLLLKIRTENQKYFDDPSLSEALSFLGSWSTKDWDAADSGRWILANTEFKSLDGERDYHWKSGLTFVRRFIRKSTSSAFSSLLSGSANEKVLILPFDIYWHATVKTDGRFHDVSLERIELSGNSFKEVTDEDRKRYGFPATSTTS